MGSGMRITHTEDSMRIAADRPAPPAGGSMRAITLPEESR
jgi:hypothetical protein